MKTKIPDKVFIWLIPVCIIVSMVMPILMAEEIIYAKPITVIFCLFFLTFLWLIVAEAGYMAAAILYGFKRTSLWLFVSEQVPENETKHLSLRRDAIALCFFSYLVTIYGFGLIYFFMSKLSVSAFNSKTISLLDAVYFSVITATTVGYGDIAPVSPLSKVTTVVEIIVSLLYGIFLFSMLTEALRSKRKNDTI